MELEAATGQSGFFEYSTDLFERSTIAQMAKDFEAVLMAVMAEPDSPISKLAAVEHITQRVRQQRRKT
jgi:D-arabinose 5-phosphate isomerase GutQ